MSIPDAAALADRYRVEREIGRGGMATVFLAEDVRHHRKVALKVLHPELSAVLGAERFLKEIEVTASLQHPHILPLFDSGESEGRLFYVMPFVEGETLRARLERERQLAVAEAVRLAREVADALQYAHGRGVVHRDIKPENILLQGDHALVADFGIALAVQQAGGQRMTQTGLSLGTPQYMAPEQAMGEKTIDARADVYALGAVTYEMLAGEPPFTGATVQQIVARVMTEDPRPLTTQRRSVPAHVEAAVLTALEKLPSDRFATAREFAEALSSGLGTRPSGLGPAPPSARGRVPSAERRVPMLPWALAALALVVAAVALWRARPEAGAAGAHPVVRFAIPAPARELSTIPRFAISRDGGEIGLVDPASGERGGVHVRRLDRAGAREVRVVARSGGTPVTLARGAAPFEGLDWGRDGQIY